MLQEYLLSQNDVERILDAVFSTLEDVGIMIQNQELLAALEGARAQVDYSTEHARLPRELVQAVIDSKRQEAARIKEQDSPHPQPPPFPALGTQVAQFYFDWEQRKQRPGLRDDLVRMLKLGDVLHGARRVGHCLLMRDVPAQIEPIEAAALLIEYARNPGFTYPHYVQQFEFLEEIGRIYSDDPGRFLIGGIFITSPLRICRRAADFMARRLQMGKPCSCGTMPSLAQASL